MDQREGREFSNGSQSLLFEFTAGEQTRACLLEVLVVVTGMCHEFPGAGGQGGQQGSNGVLIECASGEDADGAIGGAQAGMTNAAEKSRLHLAQDVNLNAADERSAGSCGKAPGRLEGIANGAHTLGTGGTQHGFEHWPEHVGVLVGVEMRGVNGRGTQALDLGAGFGFDLGGPDAATEQTGQKSAKSGVEASRGRIDERRDLGGGQSRFTIDEHNMAADTERAGAAGNVEGFLSGEGTGHQGGAGQHAALVELGNRSIDAGGEAEVVCIHNQTSHGVSVSTFAGWDTNGQVLL